MMPTSRLFAPKPTSLAAALGSLLVLSACSSGGASTAATPMPGTASEAEWQSLATSRPAPLAGAARIAVGEVTLLSENPWGFDSSVDVSLGISEMVVAGLLRRADVNLVERRRFAVAAEEERRGQTRARGAPPAGVSPGAEYILSCTWATVGLADAYLELRLVGADDGRVVTSWRATTANDADATALSRAIVGALLGKLGELDQRPAWTDPAGEVAPPTYGATSVSTAAVQAFFDGLAAEELWDWERARRGYQLALAEGGSGFVEAASALARTARLRNGGTLGASQ